MIGAALRWWRGAGTSMTGKKTANEPKPVGVAAIGPDDLKGTLKQIGGSRFDHWNEILASQALQALWLKHSDPETRDRQFTLPSPR
jgi:hypothetical protein